jgi:NCAIR mutase (PurE)-related protein
MREILDAVASGDLSPAEAEARLAGYATTDAGRFDAARERRRGIPEAVLAEGKTPAEVVSLVGTALATTGRVVVTRTDDATVAAVTDDLPTDATVDRDDRARTLVVRGPGFEPPSVDATVVVVAAGTADAAAAGEAAVLARAAGVTVDRIDDVGVAHLGRIVDHLEPIRAADAAVVAAGREGALPTVVAGLVDTPVIGLPVSTGYGFRGNGEAALGGMLQSCTVLSVVNVDDGFTAGAQAALIGRAVGAARGNRSAKTV